MKYIYLIFRKENDIVNFVSAHSLFKNARAKKNELNDELKEHKIYTTNKNYYYIVKTLLR